MSGHRHKRHLNSTKPAREIFLTSSSLSFSSLSSSAVSWDDATEQNTKETTTSYEGEFSKVSSHQCSETRGTSNVISTQPGPPQPLRLRPVQLRNNGYDPTRIPASAFGKTNGDVNWSEVSNESLFSLKMDGYRMPNSQGFRQSNFKPEEVMMSGEFLAYSPVLSIKLEDAEEEKTEVEEEIAEVKEEIKSEEKTEVTSAETQSQQQEKLASSAPIMLWNPHPSDYCSLDQAPARKKRKKTKKMKKVKKEKKKKSKKSKCCIWSWSLCSIFAKREFNLCCCFKCCCFCCSSSKGTKAMV